MFKPIKSWIWRWHFIAGILCMPIILLLSITGGIYLFKDQYEAAEIETLKYVSQSNQNSIPFQNQWNIAKRQWDKTPSGVLISNNSPEATQFISGRFSHKSSLFINPYSGKINGQIKQNTTDMHKVRKLHGELLLGSFGTKIVELIASWMIVLILTGIYLFWPKNNRIKSLFTIRFKRGKRILYRDIHTVLGFWFSLFLLLILAGGLPWTDVFGNGFKWVHQKTDTGFPKAWDGRMFASQESHNTAISLDRMMDIAKQLHLDGEVEISLPKSSKGIYSISNTTHNLSAMHKYHFDQYSGKELYHGTWSDIGFMMKTRLWVMAFHQGQFGLWNWLLVLFTTVALSFLSLAALLSYLHRRRKGSWGVPPVPSTFRVGKSFIGGIILLGLLLPIFGLSLLIIYITKSYICKN